MSDPTDYGAYLDRLLESDPEFKAAVECERRKADIGTQIYDIQILSGLVPAVFAHKCGITKRKLESVMSGDCTEHFTRKILKRARKRIRCPVRMKLTHKTWEITPIRLTHSVNKIATFDGTKWSDIPPIDASEIQATIHDPVSGLITGVETKSGTIWTNKS